jgi:hypothetical protein
MQTRWAVSLPIPPDVAASLAFAYTAEAQGYESVWVAETSGPTAFAPGGIGATLGGFALGRG